MPDKMFVNLPVKDLARSIAFFEALGFSFNPQFTDENAGCMIITETSYAMMIQEDFFKKLAPKPITDTTKSNEVLIALSCASKAEVDALVKAAVSAGGSTVDEAQDHGFMYDHGFQDLDGHMWGTFWMDPDHVRKE